MYDIIIVGSGPAGLTAGIYAGRAGKKALIVEGFWRGGAVTLTELVENYSGFKAIDGYSLSEKMREQAESFGVEFLAESVNKFNLTNEKKSILTESSKEIFAKKVILCMGTESRRLGLESELKLMGRGVSYCATCDGFFFKNKTVAVNGGGDTALTDAIYLSNICKKVYLIHRRQGFRANAKLIEKLNESGVKIILDSVVSELNGDPLESLTIRNILNDELFEIKTDGLFVAIGTTPRTELLKGQIALDESGYIITNESMQTSLAGVYAAGDIRKKELRQIITACSDGAIAATNAAAD
jgi:thioredoxin reductase (NADPH)